MIWRDRLRQLWWNLRNPGWWRWHYLVSLYLVHAALCLALRPLASALGVRRGFHIWRVRFLERWEEARKAMIAQEEARLAKMVEELALIEGEMRRRGVDPNATD